MPSAKFTQTYDAVSKMGEKLKAAGKQGPSNDEQLHVRFHRHIQHHARSEVG
jgi:diazepam-binding inhibitor (GABA receptor modulating acyl-CoA-binding protein)